MRGLSLLVLLAVAPSLTPAFAADETQLVLHIRSMKQNAIGAAPETVQGILAQFRQHTLAETFSVSAAEVRNLSNWGLFSTSYKSADCTLQPFFGPLMLGEYTFNSAKLGGPSGKEPCFIGGRPFEPSVTLNVARAEANRLGFRDFSGYRLMIADKSYQDIYVAYHVAFPASRLADLRLGQKVSFACKMVGFVDTSGLDPRYTAYSLGRGVSCLTQDILPESTMLKCANSHEYGPASGYKFCPVDGLPLQ